MEKHVMHVELLLKVLLPVLLQEMPLQTLVFPVGV